MADLHANWVESSVPKMIEATITKALKLYIEAEAKQWELMEAHILRMDRLEVMIEDHGKELASLKDRVIVVEKVGGGSEGLSMIKANIAHLTKKVASL